MLSWPHTGFNVHSMVRAKTKPEAERAGKYMIRKVYEVDPMVCPKCGGQMKVIAFITE